MSLVFARPLEKLLEANRRVGHGRQRMVSAINQQQMGKDGVFPDIQAENMHHKPPRELGKLSGRAPSELVLMVQASVPWIAFSVREERPNRPDLRNGLGGPKTEPG